MPDTRIDAAAKFGEDADAAVVEFETFRDGGLRIAVQKRLDQEQHVVGVGVTRFEATFTGDGSKVRYPVCQVWRPGVCQVWRPAEVCQVYHLGLCLVCHLAATSLAGQALAEQ